MKSSVKCIFLSFSSVDLVYPLRQWCDGFIQFGETRIFFILIHLI